MAGNKKIFCVSGKVSVDADVKVRLIRAERRSQVEAFLLNELNIAPASADDAHRAAQQGVEIEEASES